VYAQCQNEHDFGEAEHRQAAEQASWQKGASRRCRYQGQGAEQHQPLVIVASLPQPQCRADEDRKDDKLLKRRDKESKSHRRTGLPGIHAAYGRRHPHGPTETNDCRSDQPSGDSQLSMETNAARCNQARLRNQQNGPRHRHSSVNPYQRR
jgi:hypothetical protein